VLFRSPQNPKTPKLWKSFKYIKINNQNKLKMEDI